MFYDFLQHSTVNCTVLEMCSAFKTITKSLLNVSAEKTKNAHSK